MSKRQSRTPYRKSRTYGDLHGGRTRRRFADNVFLRKHNLLAPGPGEELPIVRVDNPSRDFYHPLDAGAVRAAVADLTPRQRQALTHVWLRAVKATDYGAEDFFPVEAVTGSGVGLVILYAFAKTNARSFAAKPSHATLRELEGYGGVFTQRDGRWRVHLPTAGVQRYYRYGLLAWAAEWLAD